MIATPPPDLFTTLPVGKALRSGVRSRFAPTDGPFAVCAHRTDVRGANEGCVWVESAVFVGATAHNPAAAIENFIAQLPCLLYTSDAADE